jgi:putative membrane protein insertion efficiency factor
MPAEGPGSVGRAARIILALIRGYQLLLSPLFAGTCRYVPSCSAYASEAVARHGALRGSILALRRLARCHPLGGHGFDPVPAAEPRALRRGKLSTHSPVRPNTPAGGY